jgi:hypothetical protein
VTNDEKEYPRQDEVGNNMSWALARNETEQRQDAETRALLSGWPLNNGLAWGWAGLAGLLAVG